jgi:ABC-type Fe3+ transport system permease subunit
MARPLASTRSRPLSGVPAGTGAVLVLLAATATFIGWPVASVLATGLAGLLHAAPPIVVLGTIAVAVSSTVLALTLALVLAQALTRVDVPGRGLAWRVLRFGVRLPPFVAPLALLLVIGAGHAWSGYTAIVLGQTLAFLPHATALVVRALAGVDRELEQAAEVLGASRLTVWRRVTLALAGARLRAAALLVVALCLADVATPLLLGGDAAVLASFIAAAAAVDAGGAAPAALALALLVAIVTLGGSAWWSAERSLREVGVLPLPGRPRRSLARWTLGTALWVVTPALAMLWLMVPLGSVVATISAGLTLEHWAVIAQPAGTGPLAHSVVLGLGVAVTGSALALATAWIERSGAPLVSAVRSLARVPAAVPGLVAGVGYVLAFGAPSAMGAGALVALVVVVACWELPATHALARAALAGSDPSAAQVAVTLGAGRAAVLGRIVLPAMRPMVGRLLGHAFAGGVLALGTVIVLTAAGPALGSTTMLALARAGEPGAACALATTLLVLAGGGRLLGRALGGRRRGLTLPA